MSGRFWRYLLVSAVALAIDYAVLLLLARAGMREALAAAIGYSVGAVLHYGLSRRLVFSAGWMNERPAGEFGAFIVSGLAGLGITSGIVYAATEVAGWPLALGKTIAVAASFFAVYLMRASLVFRPTVQRR